MRPKMTREAYEAWKAARDKWPAEWIVVLKVGNGYVAGPKGHRVVLTYPQDVEIVGVCEPASPGKDHRGA